MRRNLIKRKMLKWLYWWRSNPTSLTYYTMSFCVGFLTAAIYTIFFGSELTASSSDDYEVRYVQESMLPSIKNSKSPQREQFYEKELDFKDTLMIILKCDHVDICMFQKNLLLQAELDAIVLLAPQGLNVSSLNHMEVYSYVSRNSFHTEALKLATRYSSRSNFVFVIAEPTLIPIVHQLKEFMKRKFSLSNGGLLTGISNDFLPSLYLLPMSYASTVVQGCQNDLCLKDKMFSLKETKVLQVTVCKVELAGDLLPEQQLNSLDRQLLDFLSRYDDRDNAQFVLVKINTAFTIPSSDFMELAKHAVVQLHRSIIERRLDYLRFVRVRELEEQIGAVRGQLGDSWVANSWPTLIPPSTAPRNRFEINDWEAFNATHAFTSDDDVVLVPLTTAEILDLTELVTMSEAKLLEGGLVSVANGANKPICDQDIVYGQRKFDPQRGYDYVLFLMCNGKVFVMDIVKPLSVLERMSAPYVVETVAVHLTSFVCPKQDALFVAQHLKRICDVVEKHNNEKSRLNVILVIVEAYPGEGAQLIEAIDEAYSKDGDGCLKNEVHMIRLTTNANVCHSGGFDYSASSALDYLQAVVHFLTTEGTVVGGDNFEMKLGDAVRWRTKFPVVAAAREGGGDDNDRLVAVFPVNNWLNRDFVNRARLMTIRGQQMYAPVPFKQYANLTALKLRAAMQQTIDEGGLAKVMKDAAITGSGIALKTDVGKFHTDDYSTFSFYAADLAACVASMPSSEVDDGGKTVVRGHAQMIDAFRHSGCAPNVFRGLDPSLRRFFRYRSCSARVGATCEAENLPLLGNKKQLAALIADRMSATQGTSTTTRPLA